MPKVLIVDDEEAIRGLLRERLQASYEVIDTGDPVEALALALRQKPDCILLDLMLPEYSGFELCQTFSNLSFTRLIPVFVITSKPAAEYRDFCLNLGAKDYFEKPIDFAELKKRLAGVLSRRPKERRSEVRVQLNVIVKLSGKDLEGEQFDILTVTENVSANGFLCICPAPLAEGTTVGVSLSNGATRLVGNARVVRIEWRDTPWQRYGFQFIGHPRNWVLQ